MVPESFGSVHEKLTGLSMDTPTIPRLAQHIVASVCDVRRARDEGRLDRELARISHVDLLVVDELGFLPLNTDGARLLFQVVSEAYERQSLVFTTSLELSW